MKTDIWRKTLTEIHKAADSVSVLLIMRGNMIAGRITARMSKRNVLHVAFILYAINDYGWPIFGYKALGGYGYNKQNTRIAQILNECRDKLKEGYGIELCPTEWNVPNSWRKDFEAAGFSIVQAL